MITQAPTPHTAGLRTSACIFAVDPGQKTGKNAVLFPDGHTKFVDFLDFVETLQQGDIVATETTMHVYRPRDRQEVLEAAHRRGAEIWGMRSTQTSRARKELNREKSDDVDAHSIKHYFITRPNLFYRLKVKPARLGTINEAGSPRFDMNYKLVSLRREGYPGYEDLHDATCTVAAETAIKHKLSMRQFKRLLGFHGNGYPNICRSNRNKHGAGKDPSLRNDKMKEYRVRAVKKYQELKALAESPQQTTAGLNTSAS